MRYFCDSIYTYKAEAEEDQRNLLNNIVDFNNKFSPTSKEDVSKKEILMKLHVIFMRFDSELSNAFENGIFAIKATQGEGLKILTAQKRLERLPISFAQVKADNTSENL